MNGNRPPGLRISQLAEKAGVSTATVKHYLAAGLLRAPIKTGRTMAYYPPENVERILFVKKLQKERYLPLEMIKRVIDGAEVAQPEIDVGALLARSEFWPPDGDLVPEERIEAETGCSLARVRALEKEGLTFPSLHDGVKTYDSVDRQLIAIAARREARGLPPEHSRKILQIHARAMTAAVTADVRRFLTELLPTRGTGEALEIIREAEEDLDRFVILIRHKALRALGAAAVREMNLLDQRLESLNFLPVDRIFAPPGQPGTAFLLLSGQYRTVIEHLETTGLKSPSDMATLALAWLLSANLPAAQRVVDDHLAQPSGHLLANAVAGLVCLKTASRASGFTAPLDLTRRALTSLQAGRPDPDSGRWSDLLASYLIGAMYWWLPEIFGTRPRGRRLLTRLREVLNADPATADQLPAWIRPALKETIFPTLRERVDLMLSTRRARSAPVKRRQTL